MEDIKILSTEDALKIFKEQPTLETVSGKDLSEKEVREIYK